MMAAEGTEWRKSTYRLPSIPMKPWMIAVASTLMRSYHLRRGNTSTRGWQLTPISCERTSPQKGVPNIASSIDQVVPSWISCTANG
jgi:hypothetical protein